MSLYSVHPGVKMIQDWIERLPQKTGKTLDEWADLLRRIGPKEFSEQKSWLKEKYGFGTNESCWIAEYAEGKLPWEGDPRSYLLAAETYVENMFSGAKKLLQPLYEQLLTLALAIGSDVKACPCKTIVPLYRNRVFAQIKPTTKTQIDLGLALPKTPFTGKLKDSGGQAKKDRITHFIALTHIQDIDEELIHWLKKAYELDL